MPTTQIEVLSASDAAEAARWNRLVDGAPEPDIYYRPAYAYAHEVAGHGSAVCLALKTPGMAVLLPLLRRPLSELPFAAGDTGQDAVTPYGYGGLLPLAAGPPLPEQLLDFVEYLKEWCASHGIVSLLLRLHPLLQQAGMLAAPGLSERGVQLHEHGPTTALDLGGWNAQADSISTMSKGRRSDLSLARRSLTVSWQEGATPPAPVRHDHLQIFREVYEQTMDRLNAGTFYHFPLEYYRALAEGLGDRLGVGVAWLQQEPVGVAMFLAGRTYAHYHLSGTTPAGRQNKAATLLINAGAAWARQRGCQRLHLGGGTGGADTLFQFKQSFGGTTCTYSYVTIVTNPARYRALVQARHECTDLPAPRANFFPEYRA